MNDDKNITDRNSLHLNGINKIIKMVCIEINHIMTLRITVSKIVKKFKA